MTPDLTPGAIEAIVNGDPFDKPVLQIISSKKITAQGSSADRYRLLLSDGLHSYSHAMLATQLNNLMDSGEMDSLSVVQVDKYLCNTIQGDRRVLILLDLSVMARGSDIGERLGNPQQFKPGEARNENTDKPNGQQTAQVQSPVKKEPTPNNYNESAMTHNRPPQTANNFRQGNNPKTSNYSIKPSTPGTPGSTRVHAIASLTPYQNRWRIRARVTQKSGIRTWSNSRGEGKLFSVNLLDESGEIRATGFNDAVDKYYEMLEVNKIYFISKGTLKTANKQYSNLSNDYEMTFNADTIVELCNEDIDLPSVKFDFTKINELDSKTPGNTVGNNPQTSNYSKKISTPESTRVHAIANLTPYRNRWQIRARVTQKSDIIPWKNINGEGNRFSVDLLDESGEIRATGFNDAVDKYYGMLEVNKIYFVSNGTLKTANKQYNNLRNDYEMTFNAHTTVELCNEDLPSVKFGNTVDPQSPMMGTSDEIKVDKELLSKGTFISYDNCVYLGGACNVGKSTLASMLIGEEISQHWKSTDGLTIYFGRNGIDLKNKEMVPLKQDFGGDVLSKVLRGKPDMTQEKPDTTLSKNREEVLPHDSNKGNIIPETHTVTQRTDITLSTSTAPTPSLIPGTGKDDVITTIQEDIKEKIRKGTYKIEIAPSDLVDFGGQRSFDMTHQLFMRRKGTFVLMFNGRIDFLVPLKEYEQGETTESILKHWVNSILSYCADDDDDILPIIMFCATHSDDFNKGDRKDRKKKLIHDLGEIFKNHKRQHRIIYGDIFFINGQDKNDLEINKLKSKLVEVACKQKSWGKRMPMACVPLDLQMSELRLHNISIISKEELITLNQRNGDLALTDEQIKYFLNDQHSLGKIVYFDQHGLDNFINLQPQSLVNILRSFITAECFWPEDKELKGILRALTDTGKIAKQDLLKLWSQKKFHQHMPNDDFKEFIIQVLVHLDILVEPRHHRQEQGSKVKSYLVPCIVKRRLPVTDFYVKSADKMICLSYTLLKSSMPAALSFKLIGAAMNVWPLKKMQEGICLYHQAAILCIDGSNELHLLVKDDKVFVYLINKVAKCFISPNIASTVQECLTLTMTKVLEFYHESFGKSLSTLDVSKAFEIEVGEWCTSEGGCYISVRELEKETEWRCKNNKLKRHDKTYPRYWICNKKQVECDEKCPGLDEKDLELPPEEKHLFRLATLITVDECYNLVIKLGLPRITRNDIQDTDRYDNTVKKYVALCKWKDLKYKQMSKPSFKELSDALAEDYHTHFLCQLFMEDVTVYEIANSALQEIPEDDVLQDLSKEVGNCAMHLGVELGLSMAAIEGILFEYPKSIFKQTLGVMEEWKSSSKVKTTIIMLMKAFQSADGRGLTFLREKYGV